MNLKKISWQVSMVLIIGFVFYSCETISKVKPLQEVVDEALYFAEQQSLLMAQKYADQDTVLPRSFVDGKMTVSNSRWWTSGFFPGVLWYLYQNSKDSVLLNYAKKYTQRIEREKYTTDNHDVGFMLYCSFGNGYRLTKDTSYRDVLITGSKSLATRYNPDVGLIKSWDFNKDQWQFPVIIDNMMNLEMLMWASQTSSDSMFKNISISHADKTMMHHYRDDNSCYHLVSYDTITGVPHKKQTHQGYSDTSAWSRGQAWGLYGYTFMYRETKNKKYLEQAKRIASYMIYHPNMPDDYIPYWDFNAPEIAKEPKDASSAAVMASALIELSSYVENDLRAKYLKIVEKQIRTLASPDYTANLGENGNFILKHSVGSKPHNSEIDVPLTYADYYYVEALIRLKELLALKLMA